MPDIIHLLPDSVANQIAAGEVIQRPASVVKELVENAIDAGATHIQVIILDAGRTSIQVIDDGRGMSETDARLAFERHATSKIRQADDLFALRTMGFRGEALASIAAVAQVSLLTRMSGEELGTRLEISASKVVNQEPAAAPVGSHFRVDNLFFNVPARRKFLKSNATELSHILSAFERIVLVYPAISFTLHHNGAELQNLKAASLHQRIADVFGRQYSQDLLSVSVDTALCRISGFVGKPESARKKSGHDFFFVNGRFMRHPYFHKAVLSAYDRMLPEGMQVPYFIYLDVEPSQLDVNIHPTKTEIKFENEQAIFQVLTATVRDALGRYSEVPAIDFDTQGRPDIPLFSPASDFVSSPRVSYNPDYNPFAGQSASSVSSAPQGGSHGGPRADTGTVAPQHQATAVPDGWEVLYEPQSPSPADTLADKSPTHYQYKGRYVMTAVKSGLMVIDQHRADVRIRYEQFMRQAEGHAASTQRVLFPETVQFSPAEAVVFTKMLPGLTRMGFDLSDLGGNTFAVNGVPAGIEGLDPVRLLQQMAGDTASASDLSSVYSAVALSLAQSVAIPYGQVLSNAEMEQLVNELFACSNVNYTPQGKSILAILPQTEIEGLLG